MSDNPGQNISEKDTPSPTPSETKPAEQEESLEEQLSPDQLKERTRERIETLARENKELKEKMAKQNRPQGSVLDSLRPPQPVSQVQTPAVQAQSYSNLNQNDVSQIQSGLVDDQGYVDVARLEKALNDANERARKAEESSQMAFQTAQRYEESQQTRITHDKFPQLDPNSDQFDQGFYDSVRDRIISQNVQTGSFNYLSAAESVAQNYRFKDQEQKAKEVAKAQETVDKKRQINATGTASMPPSLDQSTLEQRTRMGDSSALKARLERAGY